MGTLLKFYPIGKIGSGSWRSIFAVLSGMRNIENASQKDIWKHILENSMVNPNMYLGKDAQRNFTFVFVRDPFDRLASAYYAKFVRNWDLGEGEEKFRKVKDDILNKYR